MISSSRQLKDKVRNISDGNSKKATTLIRNFMMERFLERVSISSYRDNFILKGGMLVASIVGVDMRATMDIDTTVKALPLNEADVQRIIEEICNIPLEDNVSFQIKSTRTIMEEFDYPGIRVMLEATLDRMRQPIKIDISTDDVITPKAVEYDYKLMFEDRTISVLTYNKETLLAEKMQTIINRGIANTRLRDFYDVYSIMNFYGEQIEKGYLYHYDAQVLNSMMESFVSWEDRPMACSMDICVTKDGRTLLVEFNDAYSLGAYGLADIYYAKLISARWSQLLGVKDEYHF